MGGGVIQLSYPAKNLFNMEPQVTLFKTVYHRYTNFAIQPYENCYDNTNIQFSRRKIKIPIKKIGDLVSSIVIKVRIKCDKMDKWVDRLGFYIFKKISIEIGGRVVDSHNSSWLNLYYEVYRSESTSLNLINARVPDEDGIMELFIPLRFWFNNSFGSALPVVAMQYQDISINLELSDINKVCFTNCGDIFIKDIVLVTDYIFLELEMRKKLCNKDFRYIIETIGTYKDNLIPGITNRYNLPFRDPVKEILWVSNNYDVLCKAKISINGKDIIKKMPGKYYNYAQPYMYHKCIPNEGINMYSLSLYPDIGQPSGFLNLDNTSSFTIDVKYDSCVTSNRIYIFCITYRVFIVGYGHSGILER